MMKSKKLIRNYEFSYIDVESLFSKYMIKKEYEEVDGTNIFSDPDSNTLFNIAGVSPLRKFFRGILVPDKKKLFSVQNCIRLNDLNDIGDNTHLTSFRMLGVFILEKFDKKELIKLIYEFLFSLGFKEQELIASVHPEDKDIYEFLSHSFKLKKIYYDKENIWCPRVNDISGTCTEIFVDYEGENIEIGNIVFTCGIFDGKNFIKKDFSYADVGLGCERIEVIVNKKKNVYEIDRYNGIFSFFEEAGFNEIDSKKITDHLITFNLLTKNYVFPGPKQREYICRKILRLIVRMINKYQYLQNLEIDTEIEIITRMTEFCDIENKKLLKYLFLKEIELIKIAKKNANQFIRNIKENVVTNEQAMFCLETLGLSFKELEELIEKNDKISELDKIKSYEKQKSIMEKNGSGVDINDFFYKGYINLHSNPITRENNIKVKVIDLIEKNNKYYAVLEKNISLPQLVLNSNIKYVFDFKTSITTKELCIRVNPEFKSINKKNVLCYEITKYKDHVKKEDYVLLSVDEKEINQFQQTVVAASVIIYAIKQFDPQIIVKNVFFSSEKNKILFYSSIKLNDIKDDILIICRKILEKRENIEVKKILFKDINKERVSILFKDTILSDIFYVSDGSFNHQISCYVTEDNVKNTNSLEINNFCTNNNVENTIDFSVSNKIINTIQKQNLLINKIEDIMLSKEENIIKDLINLKSKLHIQAQHIRDICRITIENFCREIKKNYFILVSKKLFCSLTDIKIPDNVIILYREKENKKVEEKHVRYCCLTVDKETEIKNMINESFFRVNETINFLFRNERNVSFYISSETLDKINYVNSVWVNFDEKHDE